MLAPALITALLKVTSGKTFEDRRDLALIRVLLSGVRRQEVAELGVEDLDLRRRPGVKKRRPERRAAGHIGQS